MNTPRSPVHRIGDAKTALFDQPPEVAREHLCFQLAVLIDVVLVTVIEVELQDTHTRFRPALPPLRQRLIEYPACCWIERIAVRRRSQDTRETVVEPIDERRHAAEGFRQ